MSQRFLIPTNLFYHWRDPWPPEFPSPNTGDIYFNVSSQTIRVFYEGLWHDGGGAGGGAGANEVEIQADAPTDESTELWIDTDAPDAVIDHADLVGLSDNDHPQYLLRTEHIVSDNAASGTAPANTVWIEY
jgi:hypothetical protein